MSKIPAYRTCFDYKSQSYFENYQHATRHSVNTDPHGGHHVGHTHKRKGGSQILYFV